MPGIDHFRGCIGIMTILLIAYLVSYDRKHIAYKQVATGLLAQFIIAIIVLKLPLVKQVFIYLAALVKLFEHAVHDAMQFVFGYIGGGVLPFNTNHKGSTFILALQALPLMIFMSALSSLLFYWNILPLIIKVFSRVFEKTLNVGGALGLGSAANIFFGTDAAPMSIKPYLKDFSQSELFAFMTVSMATVAGTVMVVYDTVLSSVIDDVIGHIISASIISIPGAITIARIIMPETGRSTAGDIQRPTHFKSSMDAITQGTMDGVQVYINVIAMIITLVAMVSLANSLVGLLPFNPDHITIQQALGTLLKPLVWLLGIPWDKAGIAGTLIATKTILNELIAYIDLSKLGADTFDFRTRLILIYALCGFANISSIGVMIGAIGTLVPERRTDIVNLGFTTIVSGTMATMLTGCMVGLLVT